VDGGALAPFKGGVSTHGSLGDRPLPAGARRLTFRLYAVGESGHRKDEPAGAIDVDLVERTATWRPTGESGPGTT
jgi:hypothetical protein